VLQGEVMAHTITYNPETHFIETKFQGSVASDEMKEIFSEALQIAIEKETFLFLSDFREATINLSTLEIYELPKAMSNTAIQLGLKPYQIKRAIVTNKDFKDSTFSENTNVNNGLRAKFFNDIEEAKKWLSKS